MDKVAAGGGLLCGGHHSLHCDGCALLHTLPLHSRCTALACHEVYSSSGEHMLQVALALHFHTALLSASYCMQDDCSAEQKSRNFYC